MDSRMNEIAERLLSVIKDKFKGDYKDVPEVLKYWHNVVYLFFSSINYRRLFEETDVSYDALASLNLIPEYLIDFYMVDKEYITQHLNAAIDEYYSTEQNVNNARQNLLNVELDFTNGEIRLFSDKISRDNTGAYYTPDSLAYQIIKKSFAGRRFDPDREYRIADFSCGGGDFFLAVTKYLEDECGIDKKTTVKWFYGVDIDPIALQICIVNLLIYADRKDWEDVVSHFIFGNPLVICDRDYSDEEKNSLFATRRLYFTGLGITEKFFENTYDIVIGNPPWEKIRFEERKFFKGISNIIPSLSQKSVRDKEVDKLRITWPAVYEWRNQVCSEYSQMTAVNYRHNRIKESVAGELNTYALFTELTYNMLSDKGFMALVIKSTLVTAPVNQKLWNRLLIDQAVKGVYLFENKKKIFSIDSRERFVVLIADMERSDSFEFTTGLTEAGELGTKKTIYLKRCDLQSINPATSTIPNVSNNEEIEFLKKAHKQFPLFSDAYSDCHFGRLIHLTAHAASISKNHSKDNVPIYEGKFLEQYDARFATFKGMPDSKKYANKAAAAKNSPDNNGFKDWPVSRFYVDKELWGRYLRQYDEEYSLCWRSLTSPSNRRTMLAMILPTCPTCQSVQMLQTTDAEELVMLLALFNSIPFDYFVRIKMPGLDLTQSVIKQIPVPSDSDYEKVYEFEGEKCSLKKHILSYVISILNGEEKLKGLIKVFKGKVYEVGESSASQKQKMIDLLFKKAYHLDDDIYEGILLSFPKYQADHIA